MLTDVILEEDFEKNGEAWYDPQDLEHGNVNWSGVAPETLTPCTDVIVGVTITGVTFTLKIRTKVLDPTPVKGLCHLIVAELVNTTPGKQKHPNCIFFFFFN